MATYLSAAAATSGTSISVTPNGGTALGNRLVLFAMMNGGAVPSNARDDEEVAIPGTFVRDDAVTGDEDQAVLWVSDPLESVPGAVVIDLSISRFFRAVLITVQGGGDATAGPWSAEPVSGSSTDVTAKSMTVPDDESDLLAFFGLENTNTWTADPAGMTNVTNQGSGFSRPVKVAVTSAPVDAGASGDYSASMGTARDDENERRSILLAISPEAPADPPVLVSATIDGDELVLTYDEALDESSVPAGSDFVVEVDEVAQSDPSAVDVDGATVVITTDEPVAAGAVVTLSYTPGANPIRADDDGSEAAALTDEPVTNNTVAPMPYAIRARIERGRRQ